MSGTGKPAVGKNVAISVACIGLAAATLIYLGNGSIVALRLAGFLLAVLFPAAALFSQAGFLRELDRGPRAIIGLALSIVAITPVFYLRSAAPLPGWGFDLTIAALLCASAMITGRYRGFLSDLRDPMLEQAGAVMFLLFPVLFCLTWMGYAARQGTTVNFYGLFPIDFGNLVGIVAMIKAAPGLPHWPVAGSEVMNYHWLYFAFPAWLSSFGGGQSPDAPCLAVCNFSIACLLFSVLCVVCSSLSSRFNSSLSPSSIVMGGTIVTLASLAMYPYKALLRVVVHFTHMAFLNIAPRNGLLLPVSNSLTMFGNSTFALVLAVLSLYLLLEWSRLQRNSILILISLFLAAIAGYSITLLPPVALAILIWIVAARVRKIPRVIMTLALVGGAGLALLAFGLHMIGSSKPIAFEFDRGLYLRHVLFAMSPLWCLAWIGRNHWRAWGLFWALIISCVIFPSFFYIQGTSTGLIDFAMKTATLIAVAAMPIVCSGLEIARRRWCSALPMLAAILICVAGGTTAAYAGRFAFERWRHRGISTVMALPADYVACLEYLRDHTPPDAIVIDPEIANLPMVPTVTIGERRIYLPTFYTDTDLATTSLRSPETARRRHDFHAWADGRFADSNLSREFARAADFLVLHDATLHDPNWTLVKEIGHYRVWRSNLAGRKHAMP